MKPHEGKFTYNDGAGLEHIKNQFNKFLKFGALQKSFRVKNSATKIKNAGEVYYDHLINAQLSWDKKDYHQAVHHSQLAVDHSTKKQVIPSFFANVYISLSTSDKSMLKSCLKKL